MINPYSHYIFPRILDRVMADQNLAAYRQQVLADVTGRVLEVGFGTGLNLPFYPASVESLAVVEPNPGAAAIARPRMDKSPLTIQTHLLKGERLPMADATFDCVISTWTLCSIKGVEQAIAEIHRVLKPGGQFKFIEHGLSPNRSIQTWQNLLNPAQKIVGDGCNLNRDIAALIQAKFSILSVDQFYIDSLPKFLGYTYQGTATKAG